MAGEAIYPSMKGSLKSPHWSEEGVVIRCLLHLRGGSAVKEISLTEKDT